MLIHTRLPPLRHYAISFTPPDRCRLMPLRHYRCRRRQSLISIERLPGRHVTTCRPEAAHGTPIDSPPISPPPRCYDSHADAFLRRHVIRLPYKPSPYRCPSPPPPARHCCRCRHAVAIAMPRECAWRCREAAAADAICATIRQRRCMCCHASATLLRCFTLLHYLNAPLRFLLRPCLRHASAAMHATNASTVDTGDAACYVTIRQNYLRSFYAICVDAAAAFTYVTTERRALLILCAYTGVYGVVDGR